MTALTQHNLARLALGGQLAHPAGGSQGSFFEACRGFLWTLRETFIIGPNVTLKNGANVTLLLDSN